MSFQAYIVDTVREAKKCLFTKLPQSTISSIVNQIILDVDSSASYKEELKRLLSLKIIKSESLFGITLFGYLRDSSKAQPIVVLKTASQNSEHYTIRYEFDILHEAIIGYYLNSLTSTNVFAKMYGYLFKSKHAINFQECILGKTLTATLKTVDASERRKLVRDTFLQLAHGLFVAQKQLQFMHYDLHGENVLLEPADPPITVHLVFGQTLLKLTNVTHIPKIIDFGTSTMILPSTPSYHNGHNGTFISNKYSTVEKENAEIIWLSKHKETSLIPLFDIYRYITYVFVKDDTLHHEDILPYFSYLQSICYKYKCDDVLRTSFQLISKDLKEWKKHYIKKQLSLPNRMNGEDGGIFQEGSIVDWCKETYGFLINHPL